MLCPGCNYPIPSWQHQGACKPVAEKVPPVRRMKSVQVQGDRVVDMLVRVDATGRSRLSPEQVRHLANLRVTENPPALPKRRGRPKKDDSLTAAQKQAAYRARKQQ